MAGPAPVSVAARRYARALFTTALERGQLAAVSRDLQLLSQAFVRAEAAPWIADPRVDEARKQELLERVLEGRADPLTRGLLAVLGRRQRSALLLEIPAALQELVDRHEGRARGLVETARPLDDARRARLEQALSAATGKQVSLEARVEPGLLGGVRVTLDGIRYDGSARGRLEQARRQLAAAELAPR